MPRLGGRMGRMLRMWRTKRMWRMCRVNQMAPVDQSGRMGQVPLHPTGSARDVQSG
jgi:hypothetical protein